MTALEEKFDYKKAGNYWLELEKSIPTAPRENIYKAMVEYIQANDTCALGTSINNIPRVTPIEYIFHEDKFYLFSEGGEKFLALEHNKHVSLSIFDKFSGFKSLKGLQIQGMAKIIPYPSEKYKKIAKLKHLNLEALAKANHILHLIEITPQEATFVNSKFKEENHHPRQKYTWSHYE